jgi:hypothetical protein
LADRGVLRRSGRPWPIGTFSAGRRGLGWLADP